MEHIGTLAETNDVLSPTTIPLFGILSPPAEQEECHFCLEAITKRTVYGIQIAVLRTQRSHRMFQDMGIAFSYRINSTLRLLQNHLSIRRHMLPLPGKIHRETQLYMCCHTKVRTECTADLAVLLSLLTYEHTLECGQLTNCNIVSG